ncbi:hypothetical protein BIFLAC_02797 [Bifidobacterium animalis subsp. lactis HN019]|nr:hypothetical protein Balac_0925 [Bifidobacterium animalis subsp. lactis Bl-04]ACS47853.1 hypothetical protein Balat_0925 [Bifidobacterium animalis subsp. lactis DSM 10140]ADG33478.1 hypothetical protein BalV_0890 [Bifidobacterium animalis subsp. lactis V9]AJD34035.1 hypothetical protein BAA6_0922 [Bifidobacterium animalis]EDT89794.1 hypothetical protein BIFLAC_02797 [Bifidobacterium animalis subsp. lactis HN019]
MLECDHLYARGLRQPGLPVSAGAAFAAFGAAITTSAHSVANATPMPAVRRNAVCMC